MGLYNHVKWYALYVFLHFYYVPGLHIASTVLMLQVPFFNCKYLLPNLQVPCSTHQQANHSTFLFTPDLLTPHTAFLRLRATVPVFWNVSTHFSYPVHTNPMPRARDAATIVENWSLTERRFRHLQRTVLGRYFLSCHTVIANAQDLHLSCTNSSM